MEGLSEARGKYFTDVVRTSPVEAEIRNEGAVIHGTLHIHPDNRVSDEINGEGQFLPVSNARLIDEQGESEFPFLTLNKRHIILVIPDDDLEPGQVDE